jgi:hypothetical protein
MKTPTRSSRVDIRTYTPISRRCPSSAKRHTWRLASQLAMVLAALIARAASADGWSGLSAVARSGSEPEHHPYRLLDLATSARTSHAMQSALRLPAAYGFYAECATPSAFGFKWSPHSSDALLGGTRVDPESMRACDAGGAVCHGIPCNFLVSQEVGVSCVQLAVVWGCQGCLRCTACNQQSPSNPMFASDGTFLLRVCPGCTDVLSPDVARLAPAEPGQSTNTSTASYCESLNRPTGPWDACVKTNLQAVRAVAEPQMSTGGSSSSSSSTRSSTRSSLAAIIDAGDLSSAGEDACPPPAELWAVADLESVFPLFVFELPLQSVVAMLDGLAVSMNEPASAVDGLAAATATHHAFLKSAAELLLRTCVVVFVTVVQWSCGRAAAAYRTGETLGRVLSCVPCVQLSLMAALRGCLACSCNLCINSLPLPSWRCCRFGQIGQTSLETREQGVSVVVTRARRDQLVAYLSLPAMGKLKRLLPLVLQVANRLVG